MSEPTVSGERGRNEAVSNGHPPWSSHNCVEQGCAATPDAVAVCTRCRDLFSEGGGKVAVETFDGSPPEVGSPRLCQACYQTVLDLVGGFLFPPKVPNDA